MKLMEASQHARVFGDAVEIIPPDQYLTSTYFEARRATVSASEIATIMGIAPPGWTSRFDLYWLKRGGHDTRTERKEMRRGKRLEALVVEDFADAHEEMYAHTPVGLLANKDRPWQTATPDGVVFERARNFYNGGDPIAGLEAKTSGSRDGWGEPGTDQVPVYYRAQCLWQLDVLGVDVTELAVWFGTDYREYTIVRDDKDILMMRDVAQMFLMELEAGQQPDIDAAAATTRRLQYMHPEVEVGEIELPPHWVSRRTTAARDIKRATERRDKYDNLIRDRLGDNRTGTVLGKKVVTRSVFTKHEYTVPEHTEHRLTFTKPKPAKETP